MFLNSPEQESLHKVLADNDRAGSLLRGITRKASDSITRIAGEIEKLKEILNTYINTAPKNYVIRNNLKWEANIYFLKLNYNLFRPIVLPPPFH